MDKEPTKKERIAIGILCIPIAVLIDALILLGAYRMLVSGFNIETSVWVAMIILVPLGLLFTRTAFMLLRYPDGHSTKHVIHPYIVFGLFVCAFTTGLVFLSLVVFSPDTFSNNKDLKLGTVLGILPVVLIVLVFAIKVQYQKILVTRRLTRTAAAQPPVS